MRTTYTYACTISEMILAIIQALRYWIVVGRWGEADSPASLCIISCVLLGLGIALFAATVHIEEGYGYEGDSDVKEEDLDDPDSGFCRTLAMYHGLCRLWTICQVILAIILTIAIVKGTEHAVFLRNLWIIEVALNLALCLMGNKAWRRRMLLIIRRRIIITEKSATGPSENNAPSITMLAPTTPVNWEDSAV